MSRLKHSDEVLDSASALNRIQSVQGRRHVQGGNTSRAREPVATAAAGTHPFSGFMRGAEYWRPAG
jgi:hypothetical protein